MAFSRSSQMRADRFRETPLLSVFPEVWICSQLGLEKFQVVEFLVGRIFTSQTVTQHTLVEWEVVIWEKFPPYSAKIWWKDS